MYYYYFWLIGFEVIIVIVFKEDSRVLYIVNLVFFIWNKEIRIFVSRYRTCYRMI